MNEDKLKELEKSIQELTIRIEKLEEKKTRSSSLSLDKYIDGAVKKLIQRFNRKNIIINLDGTKILEMAQASESFMNDWSDYKLGNKEKRPTIFLDGGITEKFIKFSNIEEYHKSKK